MLIRVAWRNIWRSKKRSFIIMIAVTIGLAAGIFLIAFYTGMIEGRVQTAVSDEYSHIQIHPVEFRKDFDLKFKFENGPKILNQVRSMEEVKAVAGRIIIKGMIASPTGSSGITINGVMPADENTLTGLQHKLISGNYFDPEKKNQVLISERLLKKLKLKEGNKVILTFQDVNGDIATSAFRIAGVFKTVNSTYDDANVFVPVQTVDELAGLSGTYNEIALLLNNNELLEPATEKLRNEFPGLEIKKWTEIAPELGLTVSVANQMVFIFMGIILLALAFGIVNTMMMAVLERTREIGILMAVGMNKFRIFSMIVLETFFLILAGCPSGIAIAGVAIVITHQTGITLKGLEDVYSTFGYSQVVYPALNIDQLMIIIFLILLTALISSAFPAIRALKLKPAESIRK